MRLAISKRIPLAKSFGALTISILGILLKTMNDILFRSWRRTAIATCCALVAALPCGCEQRLKKLPVYQVTGKIFVNGQPAEHAQISLQPIKAAAKGERVIIPHAVAFADGVFSMGTYDGSDGAPAGEYAITVTWPTVTIEGGEETFGPDRLNGRYRLSGNAIPSFTVQERDNVIPTIDIQ